MIPDLFLDTEHIAKFRATERPMRIVLVCERCEQAEINGEKAFRATLRQHPHGIDLITVYMTSPPVPGQKYVLMMKGIFPSSYSDRPCVCDVVSFMAREQLTGVDLQTESELAGQTW